MPAGMETNRREARAGEQAGTGGVSYRLPYLLGITPWEQRQVPPELVELVEGPEARPPGRALDLGCGTGTAAIYLAQHGWQVTGVDLVERALRAARRRAAADGVAPRWIQGDVTRLVPLGLGDDFDLLVDYGCFHGLTDDQRDGYAAGVADVAAPGATLLLMAFAPGRRGPVPRGADREEIARRFGGALELVAARQAEGQRLPGPLRNADPTVYRLRRR